MSVEQKNCNASNGDCLSLSGRELTEADRDAQALAAVGPLIASYALLEWFTAPSPCEARTFNFGVRIGGPFWVGTKGLAWVEQGYVRKWTELPVSDIRAVHPPERRGFLTWIRVQKSDGSCLYLRVHDKGVSPEQVWSAMHAHLPAAPGPAPGSPVSH